MDQEPRDNDWISELYHAMKLKLMLYANAALHNPDLAAEAVQDVFRIACSASKALLASKNPEGWLMNTLKNVIRDIKRAEARQTALVIKMQSVTCPDELADPGGNVNVQLLCQQYLKPADCALINMVILQGCSLPEAAQELGISLEACKKRFQRAKKILKKFF